MIVLRIDGVISDTQASGDGVSVLDIKNAKPYEDAWYWVNHYSSTYDIMFLTQRSNDLSTVTWEWFRQWDIPVDFIVFDTDERDFLCQINPSVFIDSDKELVEYLIEKNINAKFIDRANGCEDNFEYIIDNIWKVDMP